MIDPLVTSKDAIRQAIEQQIRALGGTEQDVDDIAFSAAYAVWLWSWTAAQHDF
jgi:hypothetical protein